MNKGLGKKLDLSKIDVLSEVDADSLMSGVGIRVQCKTCIPSSISRQGLYIITEGIILIRSDVNGSILEILSVGEFFGENSLFYPDRFNFVAEALTAVEIIFFPEEVVMKFLENKKFIAKINFLFSEKTIRNYERCKNILEGTSEEKINYFLQEVIRKSGRSLNKLSSIGITHHIVGAYCGLTRETVARLMSGCIKNFRD